jgi:hypothetical protein
VFCFQLLLGFVSQWGYFLPSRFGRRESLDGRAGVAGWLDGTEGPGGELGRARIGGRRRSRSGAELQAGRRSPGCRAGRRELGQARVPRLGPGEPCLDRWRSFALPILVTGANGLPPWFRPGRLGRRLRVGVRPCTPRAGPENVLWILLPELLSGREGRGGCCYARSFLSLAP